MDSEQINQAKSPSGQPLEQPDGQSANLVADADNRGLPLWMPLLGLVIAFAVAVFVGIRVAPTLSGLVFQPEPPMPVGGVQLVEHFNKGSGRDEYVYNAKAAPCEVARYYADLLGNPFNYDINAPCNGSVMPVESADFAVGTVQGKQSIGGLNVFWEVRINGNNSPEYPTTFRIVREIGK